MIRMHRGLDDTQINKSRTNYLVDGENEIDVENSSFLPMLEFVDWFNHPVVQTFLTPDGIVLEELLNFMEPAITIRDRNHNYTNYDTSKRYLYPMKVCEANDFIKRGYKMS